MSMPNNVNATAGPSNTGNNMNMGHPNGTNNNFSTAVGNLPPNVQAMYHMLQNPNHQFVQYMARSVPGFLGLPVQQQLQKMVMAQVRSIIENPKYIHDADVLLSIECYTGQTTA